MTTMLELEQQDIELQLEEIQLKRRMVEIEREKLEKNRKPLPVKLNMKGNSYAPGKGITKHDLEEAEEKIRENVDKRIRDGKSVTGAILFPSPMSHLHLHYSKSAKETVMKIAGVTPEGCILVSHGANSSNISKKYNVRSLRWIKDNLPKWSKRQKTQSHFWTNIAAKYSRKFFDNDSISRTTIEKLCYLVDSGMMDKWFDEYDHLKNQGAQSQLQLEEC